MVNGYTRQFWKELEEPTQSEKINKYYKEALCISADHSSGANVC